MIYVYACDICNSSQEIIKSLSHIDDPETCAAGHSMRRTLSWTGEMKPGDIAFKPDYYHAFGKTLTNPGQLRDELKRAKYEQGIELVNVGNDRPTYTKPQKKIDYNEVGHALNYELRKRRGR